MAMQFQAPSVPKMATEDISLTVNNADGGKTTFPVPAGTHIYAHFPALHYNCTLGLFLSQGVILTEVSQRGIGKTPTRFGQRGSLRIGQGTRSYRSAQVGLVPVITPDLCIMNSCRCSGVHGETVRADFATAVEAAKYLLFFFSDSLKLRASLSSR